MIRSNRVEKFLFFDLWVIIVGVVLTFFYDDNIYVMIVRGIADIIFFTILCIGLLKTNNRLAKVFKQLNDDSYPQKTVIAVLVIFLITGMNFGVQILLEWKLLEHNGRYYLISIGIYDLSE